MSRKNNEKNLKQLAIFVVLLFYEHEFDKLRHWVRRLKGMSDNRNYN